MTQPLSVDGTLLLEAADPWSLRTRDKSHNHVLPCCWPPESSRAVAHRKILSGGAATRENTLRYPTRCTAQNGVAAFANRPSDVTNVRSRASARATYAAS